MQLNKDYEPEISLRDLFFHVLYRWRSILVVAWIGAVLLGGYKYFSMRKNASIIQTTQQFRQNAESDEEELKLNRKIEEKAKQIEELEDYLNDSVYINLNPQGIWMARCKYLVKTDSSVHETSTDPIDSILPMYSYPLSGTEAEELVKVFNTNKVEYANELVETEINTEENTITVTAKGATKEFALKGLEYVQAKIDYITSKTQGINPHSLLVVGEEVRFASDLTAASNSLSGRKTALNTALDQYRTDLQALREKIEVNKSIGIEEISKKDVIKFAIIGFLIGALMTTCVYVLHYTLRGRLIDGKALSEQYTLPLLGEFKRSASIHDDKGLDKLLSRWELGKNRISEDTIYNNICALIAELPNHENILLVSTLKEDKLIPVKNAMAKRIKGKIIDVKGHYLTDSDAISEAAKASVVILVEEKGTSMNKEIEQMTGMLMISKANVIGTVVR